FFFSSRRRHTRCYRDWSSDVCSSDLVTHKVHYSPLEFTIVERGALESANNHDIVCRVKAKNQQTQTSTTIKWIIDDGTQVVHDRSEERRVGKECRSRGAREREEKKTK